MSAIVNFNQNKDLFVIASGLLHRKSSPFLNLPVIPTLRDIVNLIECMAMFYFIKGLSVFRIVTEPCPDHLSLSGWYLYMSYIIHSHTKQTGTLGSDVGVSF